MAYLLFGGGMYMVLMGFIWLIHPGRNTINHYFSAMYISTGLIVLYSWAERTRVIFQAWPLYNMQIPLCYIFAPLLFYGFSQITNLDRKPAAFFPPHFIPAAVSFAAVIVTNLMNAQVFEHLPENILPQDLHGHPAFFLIHLLGLGSNLYILFFLSRNIIGGVRFFRQKKLGIEKELRLLLAFIGIFYFDILLMIIAHTIRSIDLLHTAKFMSSATFIFYSFFSFRYPEYTRIIISKSRTARYKNTQLRGLNKEAVLERLSYLMEEEKAYREMELSLVSLSSQLMVTPHQLSEILNEHLHLNFNTYLNGYRIRDAERLLIEQPDSSILQVAFEVGFNSKASFNNNFLRRTGMSPSDYRKKHAVPVG